MNYGRRNFECRWKIAPQSSSRSVLIHVVDILAVVHLAASPYPVPDPSGSGLIALSQRFSAGAQ